jgi:hypothetical protein
VVLLSRREGSALSARSWASRQEALLITLCLIYRDSLAESQTWERRERNAAIYRRLFAGEYPVEVGCAFGLSDCRIRDIIEHERMYQGDKGNRK